MSDFYVEIFNCLYHIPASQHICKVVETDRLLRNIIIQVDEVIQFLVGNMHFLSLFATIYVYKLAYRGLIKLLW